MPDPFAADFDDLLSALTTRQHLAPHGSLGESLARLTRELHMCPQAVEQSLAWLQLDARKSIGRLRRTELMQLARTLHRIWRQQLSDIATTASS